MTFFTTSDPREIAALRARETRGAIPLYAALPMVMCDPDGGTDLLPVAFLDTRTHPALTDLWRVMAQEPEGGDASTTWRVLTERQRITTVLHIVWTAPVHLSIRLVFTVQAHRDFLTLAAQRDMVLLCCQPPGSRPDRLIPIIVQPEGHLLGLTLATERRKGGGK